MVYIDLLGWHLRDTNTAVPFEGRYCPHASLGAGTLHRGVLIIQPNPELRVGSFFYFIAECRVVRGIRHHAGSRLWNG